MVRSELVARIAEQNLHLYTKDVEAAVDAILGTMAEALAQGGRIELRDFGALAVRHHALRVGRNPRTGAVVAVAERLSVYFKPGKAMCEGLNLKPVKQEDEPECLLRAT